MKKVIVLVLVSLMIFGCGVTKKATSDDSNDSKQTEEVSTPPSHEVTVTGNTDSLTPCTRSFTVNTEEVNLYSTENATLIQLISFHPITPDELGLTDSMFCINVADGLFGKTLTVAARGVTSSVVIDTNTQRVYAFRDHAASFAAANVIQMNLPADIMSISNSLNYVTVLIDGVITEHYLLTTFNL